MEEDEDEDEDQVKSRTSFCIDLRRAMMRAMFSAYTSRSSFSVRRQRFGHAPLFHGSERFGTQSKLAECQLSRTISASPRHAVHTRGMHTKFAFIPSILSIRCIISDGSVEK